MLLYESFKKQCCSKSKVKDNNVVQADFAHNSRANGSLYGTSTMNLCLYDMCACIVRQDYT